MTGKKGAEQQTVRARVAQPGATAPGFDRTAPPIVDFATKQPAGSFSLKGESSYAWLSALYQSIVETSPDAITVTGVDGKIVFCNHQAALLHGFTRSDEMVGRQAWEFVAREDRDRAAADFRRMQSAGAIEGVEYTLQRADGERVPVQLNASAIKDSSGKSRAFIGIVRDVTQHQRAEEALRRSEEHFRTLIENAPDLITLMSPTGVIRYQSPSVERVLGFKPDELVGTNIWTLVNPDDAKVVGDAFVRGLFTPGSFIPVVFRVRHKNGPWRYLEGTGKLLTDENGRPFAIINSRDVTDRVLAEQALEENERRKAAILDTALDAIITIDHESKILEFNPAAEDMFGYSTEEVIGSEIDELIVPPSLRKRHRRGMKRYLEGGEGPILGQRIELTAMRADKSEFPVELAVVRIKSDGPPLFTAHVRDLTERRRWVEELEQAKQELERKVGHKPNGENAYTLTLRELTVLHLVARGKADKEIAVTLGISSQTVNKHVARILHKMGASSRTEAGVRAIKDQIVE
jgi:PAS domain S-box-containing protein